MRVVITSVRRKRSSSSAISSVTPALAADERHQSRPEPMALGNREPEGFDRRQVGEQLVDLEGAGDAEPHPLVRLEIDVMSSPSSRMSPGGRAQHAGEQIDEGGLAGAVRADQRVARALLDRDRNVARRRRCRRSACRGYAFRAPAPWISRPSAAVRPGASAPRRACVSALLHPLDPAADAVAARQHDGNEEEPDPELPVAGREVGEEVLQQPVDERAERGRHRASRCRR